MSDSSQLNNESIAIAENTHISMNRNTRSKGQEKITVPAAPNNCTLPQIRMEKVFAVRQQLAEGTYDLDMRLDIVVDRLLKKLIT